jgi:hypothetical protein
MGFAFFENFGRYLINIDSAGLHCEWLGDAQTDTNIKTLKTQEIHMLYLEDY